MRNKELLEKKKKLQETCNILKIMNSIKILHIYETNENPELTQIENSFNELGVYSNDKKPDDRISSKSTEDEIIQWISGLLLLKKNDILFLYCNGLWVKIEVTNEQLIIKELWNHERNYFKTNYCVGFRIVLCTMDRMFEFGFDSRDEYNILFDEYKLNTLNLNK